MSIGNSMSLKLNYQIAAMLLTVNWVINYKFYIKCTHLWMSQLPIKAEIAKDDVHDRNCIIIIE